MFVLLIRCVCGGKMMGSLNLTGRVDLCHDGGTTERGERFHVEPPERGERQVGDWNDENLGTFDWDAVVGESDLIDALDWLDGLDLEFGEDF